MDKRALTVLEEYVSRRKEGGFMKSWDTDFQPGSGKTVPTKKRGKKGHPAINEVVTIDTHKCIRGVGFWRSVPLGHSK